MALVLNEEQRLLQDTARDFFASHAPVAALRETSIVFALLLTRLFVGEQIGRRRLVAAGLVVAGVMALRLA